MFSLRPPQPDPNLRPTIRSPREQLVWAHRARLAVYAALELLITPAMFQFFAAGGFEWFRLLLSEISRTIILCLRLRLTVWEGIMTVIRLCFDLSSGMWGWAALGLVYLAKTIAMFTRYRATFAAGVPQVVLLILGHTMTGLCISLAFLSRAGGPSGNGPFAAYELPHHFSTAILSGLIASLSDALLIFYWRGYQSSRGTGVFSQPPTTTAEYSILSRGYDQALFEVDHFIKPVRPPAYGPPTPRYARMLIPPLPESPHDVPFLVNPAAPEWIRYVVHYFLARLYLLWQGAEIGGCVVRSILTCMAVLISFLLCEALLRMLSALIWDDHYIGSSTVGSAWQALRRVSSTTALIALYTCVSLSISTLLLYHILRQPVEFSRFTTLEAPVLKYWLDIGWSTLLANSLQGRAASLLVARDEDMWREEMETYQQVLYRTAITANNAYFPPQVDAHNRGTTVMEKLYRAHAYQDMAILADTSAGRRKWIYFEMKLWLNHCRPMIVVINALTLQLELQIEASGRVEGGVKSPLDTLHSKLGVAEPRDAELIAKLIIESEVQRRLEENLHMKIANGEPIEELPEILLLPYLSTWYGKKTLRKLALPTIDIQVVEMAAFALGQLFKNSVGFEKGTQLFEDPKGVSRHTIPAALVALLSCQLAIHLYSMTAFGEAGARAGGGRGAGGQGGGKGIPPRFRVMRDRPSIVIPKLCGVSRAIDQAIELIVVNFYESDFASFTFAPLYAKALKTYVECLRERRTEVENKG